jgi:hypothetical protein
MTQRPCPRVHCSTSCPPHRPSYQTPRVSSPCTLPRANATTTNSPTIDRFILSWLLSLKFTFVTYCCSARFRTCSRLGLYTDMSYDHKEGLYLHTPANLNVGMSLHWSSYFRISHKLFISISRFLGFGSMQQHGNSIRIQMTWHILMS